MASASASALSARAVLLSEIQSVLSIARRRYGFLLAHQSGMGAASDEQEGVFPSFARLRARLLRCKDLSELNPTNVLRPFLDLVRHEHTSSTLTGAALEAVQRFLQCWGWGATPSASVSDALSEIVDAVSQCRFQETSAESDQNVLVLVVHVLHGVLTSPSAHRLSDHSMWQLVESLYALSRANRNDPHITLSLRSTATNFLHQAIAFIFQSPAVYSDSETHGFGLPCAVKIFGFLCQKLQPRGSAAAWAASSSSLFVAPMSPAALSSSRPTRREVMLSFSLLQQALVVCDAEQLVHVPALMLFVKDDLSSAILRYCRLGASTDMKIPVLCLSITRLLWNKLRGMLKMQIEALFNGIFCHTLHWTIAHLDLSHPIFPGAGDVLSSLSGEGSAMSVDAVREEFTGEMVSLNKLFAVSFEILDCLVDLLADPSLLQDLYVNYDCDGNRSDLTQTMFDLMSQVVTKSHLACQETQDEVHFLWAQAMGESMLRGLFNALYAMYIRTQDDSLNVPTTNGTSLPEDSQTANALHHARQRKKLFQRGIQDFNRKPLAGIKYLQHNGFLSTPLDAGSLAAFLRSLPPGLHKPSVGMYLGSKGKEVKDFEKTDIHEADTIDFHQDVLRLFVGSFNFEGEGIVSALRMFLASFRLPGEAQQIDRILNEFSVQVYEQSRDRFLMASPDVAYLLSFSLIMLNTDLHNANIRPEKKMKLHDFIKNNRNYGEEVSKNQDLPDEFLKDLYDAIAKDAIKTREDDSKHGEVTMDRWKDLLNQAESDPLSSRLITNHGSFERRRTRPTPLTIETPTSPGSPRSSNGSPGRQSPRHRRRSKKNAQRKGPVLDIPENKFGEETRLKLNDETDGTSSDGWNPDQLYDHHIYELIQHSLIGAFSSVFKQFVNNSNRADGITTETPGSEDSRVLDPNYLPEKGMLQLACNGFVLCAGVAAYHALVADFNAILVMVCKFSALYSSDMYPIAYNGRENGVSLFCDNQSAPVATAAMLKLVATYGPSIECDTWKHVLYVISALREFDALPESLLFAPGSANMLLSDGECVELIAMIIQNQEQIKHREELKARELASGTESSGSFFSGVAWLMSALDTGLNGPPTMAIERMAIETDLPDAQNPADLAVNSRDLILCRSSKSSSTLSPRSDEFGTSSWIRQTLQPYRIANLVDDVSALPFPALIKVFQALDEVIVQALTGSPQTEAPGSSSNLIEDEAESVVEPTSPQSGYKPNQLSHPLHVTPAGCVLMEHLLGRISTSVNRERFDGDVDGAREVLEAHYLKVVERIHPVLVTNCTVNGITYENAGFVLEKVYEGLLSLALRARSEKMLRMLVTVLGAVLDMNAEDEMVRPFLPMIMSGLKRIADVIDLQTVRFGEVQWLTVSNLVAMAAEQTSAATHAFAFVEKLVAVEVWLSEFEGFSLMELFSKVLLFALQDSNNDEKWPARRPIELLSLMFERLPRQDPELDEEKRLRQLGGMALVCRYHLYQSTMGDASSHPQHFHATDSAVVALECLAQMIHSTSCREVLTGGAWLDVLNSGLLAIGAAVLHWRPRQPLNVDDPIPSGSFLYFERNLPTRLIVATTRRLSVSDESDENPKTLRRRRSSSVKDPLALRPLLLLVEMISWVACEQLDQLIVLPRFAHTWGALLDLLLSCITLTSLEQGSAGSEEVQLALERRTLLSAHEEIVGHVKSVIRRLTVLQTQHKESTEVVDENARALSSARFHALMHVLVEKCQTRGEAFYEQMFPGAEDSPSEDAHSPIDEEREEDDAEKTEKVEGAPETPVHASTSSGADE